MRKLILLIIAQIFIFSNGFIAYAQEGTIEEMLELNFGVELIGFQLAEMPDKTFKNSTVQSKYNQLQKINLVLIDEFYNKYKTGEIDYYTTYGIIENHGKFIYHSEMLFKYLEIKFNNPEYSDADEQIINSYNQMRINYKRVQALYRDSK